MAPNCSICIHPDRADINKALINKVPLRHIAARYGTTPSTLSRHAKHIPHLLARAASAQARQAEAEAEAMAEQERVEEETVALEATDLLGQIQELRVKSMSLLEKAEQKDDYRTALAGIREARACLELLAELEGKLNRNPIVNVLISPQWVQVRAVIMDALQHYPSARVAVAESLLKLEGKEAG